MTRAVAGVCALLDKCRAKALIYSPAEVAFLRDVAATRFQLTAKQMEWLEALATREPVNFEDVNRRALAVLAALCRRWLPDGTLHGGKEWVARNPTRTDGFPGSFRINVNTGKWADFADDAKGGDPVSLAAYLFHSGNQMQAAISVKRMLGT